MGCRCPRCDRYVSADDLVLAEFEPHCTPAPAGGPGAPPAADPEEPAGATKPTTEGAFE